MNLMKINDLHRQIQESLSTFFKLCPICGSRFKDTLDRMILCNECDREDKINKLLNE